MSNQIEDDIENWSEDRLELWFSDTLARYDIVDLDHKRAIANATATLMTCLTCVLARSSLSAEECGIRLMVAIKQMRALDARRQGQR